MENTQYEPATRKDSNKVYFLILVIVALLGTNAYLFFKDKKASDKIVTLTDEKSRMEIEIDKIEAELDKANTNNVKLSSEMKENQELARQKINELREELRKGKLTQGQLAKAQEEVKQLRYFVSKYTSDLAGLQKKNQALISERDSLKTTVANVSEQASRLEQQNSELNSKVKVAAALKSGAINITPIKVRNNGKETEVSRAGSAKKLRISFTIADNPISEKGMHDIFVRIVDPTGNLIVSDNGSLFTADGDDLQYTYKTAIEFDNAQGKVFNIDWTNPGPFQKGTYTVILYSDGYTMGTSKVNLK
ncbi:hypothetical protein [Arcticibacter tournemirensis]|uniref:Chromosome partitioning protein ParA n=1 Tax=Arcticibacter tournemirensis TaxID=699437 RepID=A0A4Q0MEC8_9SPHI|nr:hypothetical protein [Arcticibacter tournemirensis]RXF71801.1 hypothetical protein EKH83_03695 [Arcticibacter tournemirensis]